MNAPLTLYHLSYCPFCHKVRRAAAALGVELHLVDIQRETWAREMLLAQRGRATVPVLGIPTDDGEVLLGESSDIVDYLRDHVAEHEAA